MQNDFPQLSFVVAEKTPTYQKKINTFSLKDVDKSNWEKVMLGEVCEIIKGINYTTEDYDNGKTGLPFITLKCIAKEGGFVKTGLKYLREDFKSEITIKENDLFIANTDLTKQGDVVGSPMLLPNLNTHKKIFMSMDLSKLIPKNSLDKRFLYFLLKTNFARNYMKKHSHGTTVLHLRVREVPKFSFLLPPLAFQEQFSALLWDIETQINHATNVENDLKALKKGLLHKFFGKKEGEKVRFVEIANCISQQVKPKETNLDIYIGLEHLEPENLRITNFGKPSDVQGVKLKAKKGDVIFGKRRAYQKKVAICEFDAIVSAHSMILRANTEKVNVDFLPYFMQSDEFMDRAVAISEGSLSPTIKWKVLANQEFYIPLEKEKQKQIAELLKNFDTQLDNIKALKSDLQALKKGLINEIIA